jgi:hypothetical protein
MLVRSARRQRRVDGAFQRADHDRRNRSQAPAETPASATTASTIAVIFEKPS